MTEEVSEVSGIHETNYSVNFNPTKTSIGQFIFTYGQMFDIPPFAYLAFFTFTLHRSLFKCVRNFYLS